MSGFTVEKTPVIQTNLVKVVCNACQGKCYYAALELPGGGTELVYKCVDCQADHPNPNGDFYRDIEYIT